MPRPHSRLVAFVGVTLLLFMLAGCGGGTGSAASPTSTPSSTQVTVFAKGLENPRGLTFSPDGNLFVAEGGFGGPNSTVGKCTQVPMPIGPYKGAFSARISKISHSGTRSTIVGNLPSSQTTPASGSNISGVSDIQFINGTLYGMESGAGCSHGLAETNNTIFRVNPDRTTTTIANLSAFLKANPVAHPDHDDFEPDGTWFGMVAVEGVLYATEPNHQELDRITQQGQISRVIDMSTQFIPPSGWRGPTGITFHNGNFYVGTLGTFPVHPGSENIYKITPEGQISVAASGLSTVLGVAFDAQGRLFALESITTAGPPGPASVGSGKLVCIGANGQPTIVVSGLTFPSAMTFGPDGALYVSNMGFGSPTPDTGEIMRININGLNCP